MTIRKRPGLKKIFFKYPTSKYIPFFYIAVANTSTPPPLKEDLIKSDEKNHMSYWRRAIKTRAKLFLHLHLEYILHTQKTHILSASSAPDSTHENTRDPQIQTVLVSFILICHADNSNKTQTLKWHGDYVVKKAKPSGIWHAKEGAVSTFSSSLKGELHFLNDSPRGPIRRPPDAYILGTASLPGPCLIGSREDSVREMRLDSLMVFCSHHFTEMAEFILSENLTFSGSHFLSWNRAAG